MLTEQCAPLTAEHTAAVQDLVLDAADGLSTSELRELTAQAVITVDPAGAQDRHERAAATRELKLRSQPDAMATLTGYLPADGAVKIFHISDLLATSTAGAADDTRGIGARRIDAPEQPPPTSTPQPTTPRIHPRPHRLGHTHHPTHTTTGAHQHHRRRRPRTTVLNPAGVKAEPDRA